MIDTDKFRYQVVIQLPIDGSDVEALDDIVALEEDALERLSEPLALVDGHDIGSEESNLFILTDKPHAVIPTLKELLARRSLLRRGKIAYRALDSDEFVCVWPEGLKTFDVK